VAKQSAKEGRSVRDVVKEQGLLKGAELDRALDVTAMTEPGVGKGGGGGG
jgi:aspartate ammonia-lyase